MSSKFYGLWKSEIWKLVPESQQKCFLVHGDLLSSLSEPLRVLTERTKSDEDRQINIGAWDTETLGRFVEYVYTGDYHCPDPVPLKTPVSTPLTESIPEHGAEEKSMQQAASDPPSEEFEDGSALERPLTPLSECYTTTGLDPPRKLSAAEQFTTKYFDPTEYDFEEVFLTHARIYALALRLEIETLCTLSIQRLLRTLVDIGSVSSDSPIKSNFVELMRYTYSSTNSVEDPLRRIVSQFAAFNFTTLRTKEMKELIKERGDFASDLMEKISRRFAVIEKDNETLRLQDEKQKAAQCFNSPMAQYGRIKR